jgi:hypothetical protein
LTAKTGRFSAEREKYARLQGKKWRAIKKGTGKKQTQQKKGTGNGQ